MLSVESGVTAETLHTPLSTLQTQPNSTLHSSHSKLIQNLLASTVVNRPISKQKFYERLEVTAKLKRLFVDQIEGIVWRHKLSPDTLNLAAGERARELQVFEAALKGPELDEAVLKLIDRGIPYPILFVLSYEDKVQARIGYKAEGRAPERYFGTDWLEALPLRMEGLDIDAVYEGFIRQIAP